MKKNYSIGIDIGGTKMLAVLFDGKKVILDYKLATPRENIDHFMVMLGALVEPLMEKASNDSAEIKGIGLGIAGVQDKTKTKVFVSPNLDILNGVKIAELVENKFCIPTKMDNDAGCFLRAEVKVGAAKKFSNVYGLTIGTGIGGAWWCNDAIYEGAHGVSNEPSMMVIDHNETLTLEEAYQKLFQNNVKVSSDDAYSGDPLSQKSFEEWGDIFGKALANIVNIIDPEVFVLGGSAVEVSDLYLSNAIKSMKRFIESPDAQKTKVLKSKLNSQAGAIGAALLVDLK